jgi:hypothetical protein
MLLTLKGSCRTRWLHLFLHREAVDNSHNPDIRPAKCFLWRVWDLGLDMSVPFAESKFGTDIAPRSSEKLDDPVVCDRAPDISVMVAEGWI